MATEPRVSVGTIATTSNPVTPVGRVTVQAAPAEFNDVGTNAPTVTLQQSQATPSTSGAVPYNPPTGPIQTFDDGSTIQTFDDGSTLATGTDGKTSATNATDIAIVAPKGPAAGSAPADAGPAVQPAQPQAQPGRNKYFNNDYYMDDLEINGFFMAGIGPSTFQDLSFKVTEPNGITLAYNLNRAIRDLYKQDTAAVNLATFVMVIRFYGWDEKGNLVTNIAPVPGTPGTVPNNSNAVVVKYLPFTIQDLDFKMNGKVVEYHIKAAGMTNYRFAQSTALGTVPHDWQLVGETVEQVLNGISTAVTVSGDDSIRKTTESPAQATSPTASVNDIRTSAGVNENGNFTGETASPTQVGA